MDGRQGEIAKHRVGTVEAGQLVVGELLANALEHSPGDIWVSVDWTDEQPVVAVHDLGPAFAARSRLPLTAAEGGRGLYLVRAC